MSAIHNQNPSLAFNRKPGVKLSSLIEANLSDIEIELDDDFTEKDGIRNKSKN